MPSPARPTPGRTLFQGYRSLAGSMVVHATVLAGGLALAGSGRPAPASPPIAFAVQDSMFRPDAPPASEAPTTPVAVHVEPSDDAPTMTPAEDAERAEPAAAPDAAIHDAPVPAPPRFARPEHFARCRVARPAAQPTEATTRPDEAEAAPGLSTPSPSASLAEPEVQVPEPGDNPNPEYPPAARRRGIEGTVVVRIEVTGEGLAGACTILVSSGNVQLDDAALRAARRWRFRNGPGVVEQPFRFELMAAPAAR